MKPELTLTFRNIGPVKGDCTLVFRPGLNILIGKNGLGKSEIIKAATIATSGSGRLNAHQSPLPDGTVRVLPATVTEGDKVLAKTSRDRAALVPSSLPAAPMDALHQFLTGDGIADPGKADERRIKAIAMLLPSAMLATSADVLSLGTDTGLAGRPLLDVAEDVKGDLNADALSWEKQASEQAGIIRAKQADRAALKPPRDLPAELAPLVDSDLDAMASEGQRLKSESDIARERATRRADLEKARDSQTPRPDPESLDVDIEKASETSLKASEATKEARDVVRGTEDAIRVLQARLTAEKAIVDSCIASETRATRELQTLGTRRQSLITDAAKWDTAQDSFKVIETLPTDADAKEVARLVEEARKSYLSAKLAHDIADEIKAYALSVKTLTEAEVTARNEQEKATLEGQRLRKLAASVAGKVGRVLASKGIPAGLTISEGRLYASVDGKVNLFADPSKPCLSDGQRIAVVLDLALAAYPGRVIPIEGRTLAELEPAKVRHFAALASEKGAIILSARPNDSEELAVEWEGAAEPGKLF